MSARGEGGKMGHLGSAWDAAAGVWLDWMTRMSWQVAVLVAVVLAISLLARKASARFRYLLWCLVLLKLCLPPGIAFVTGIGQWFPLTPEAPLQTSTMEALPAPTLGEFVPGPSYQTAPFAAAPAVLPHSLHVSWPRALFGIWLVGLLGMMGLLARQYLRLRRHLSGSAPVQDPQVLDAFRQAREAIGVGSRVRLLTSASLSSPILVGLVRPRIMLPAGALEDLPADQLRPVLLHELAHLRRRDLWVNWIQVILQSLYWFHPLVWLANLRLRREREMIVDDVVLSHLGGEREVYGNSLLSVVKQAARKRVLTPGYVGIVETKGSIAGRLRRILDANRKLSIRLGWLSAAALIALALLLIPQARPEFEAPAKAQEPKAEETPAAAAPQWKATLPGGVTVELVGVSHYPSEGQPWWRPDGSATAERPYDRWVGFGSVWSGEAEREKAYNRSFALRIGGLESIFGRAVVHRVEPTGLSKGTTAPQSGGKDLQNMYAIAAALPEGAETCTIRFGLAGDWTTLMEHDGKAWTRHKTQECGEVALAQAEKADGGTRIAVSHHMPDDQDARLVAEDNQGGIHASREEKLHPSPQIVLFDNLQPADIRYFRLEVRPFRWVEFRNVSLEPGHKTDVEVVVEPPWGEAVDGVQVRLRADRTVWQAGQTPTFKVEVKNSGERKLRVTAGEWAWEIEVDGLWYHATAQGWYWPKEFPLGPAAQQKDLPLVLEQWAKWRSKEGDKPIAFEVGKHTIRVALVAQAGEGDTGGPVRAITNPVEIVILPAGGMPAGNAKLGLFADLPEFHELDLSVTEKTLQRMIAEKGLRNICTEDSVRKTYHVYRSDGENAVVMFQQGKCAGVQRMRKDASYADKLFNGLGKAAESLQVRLRVDKKACEADEDLALKADVTNVGKEDVAIYADGNNGWAIEVDGQWYSSDMSVLSLPLMVAPGGSILDISVPPTWTRPLQWSAESDKGLRFDRRKALTLEPGRHTIRVAVCPLLYSVDAEGRPLTIEVSPGGPRVASVQATPGKPQRAVSNPVEIEILPPSGAAAEGGQTR